MQYDRSLPLTPNVNTQCVGSGDNGGEKKHYIEQIISHTLPTTLHHHLMIAATVAYKFARVTFDLYANQSF